MPYECKLIECYPGFGPTVVTDGNMEDDPENNWDATDAAVTEEETDIHDGCFSLKVVPTAAPGWISQSITVEPGHRYRIGVWGLTEADTDQWRVTIYLDSTAGLAVRWTSDWHNNDTAWEEEVKFYRIPDDITTIEVRAEVDQIDDVAYFDDITVRREFPVPDSTIDLQYHAAGTAGFSLLNRGIQPGRPERVSLYGGRLELELVRREDGKRIIPLRLVVEGTDGEDLIDRVNALEEMLLNAARYRKDGWGGEVFLQFKIDDATHNVWFPVCEGEIETSRIYEKCGGEPVAMIKDLPVEVTCEPYWESDFTYDLENLLDNPGFEEWNDGICDSEPDCWTLEEDINAGTGENYQETDIVEEGCEALRIEVDGIDDGDWKGVTQDLGAAAGSGRVRDGTEYTLLAWVQNEAITDGALVIRVNATSGLLATVTIPAVNADYTLVSCQFTTVAGDAAGFVDIDVYILASDDGCTGIVHIDKMQVMEASNVPTGWMSSSYLWNHYDRDANQINFLSVCDIPGESEAESRVYVELDDDTTEIHIAKRTRDNPCNFIWELLPVDAVEGTDATIIGGDGTAPGGSRIDVDFIGNQTMVQRCYWEITDDLTSYYGKFMLGVLCKASAATDVINMEIRVTDVGNAQGSVIKQTVPTAAANQWRLMTGWEVVSFRIGTSDNDLLGAGNVWRIRLYAEIIGAAAWDVLSIAGVYLIPLDEAYLVGNGWSVIEGGTSSMIIKDMDGDKGLFAYRDVTDMWYPNLGAVGTYPSLTPEVENWLYFILTYSNEVDITDTSRVNLAYRPRGIFLRGTNP